MQSDIGLLILRISFAGTMLAAHGWSKLANFSTIAPNFLDPIGLGSQISLGLAVFAEFFCALAIIVGVKTRLAAIPFAITMAVAVFLVHGGDPFAKMEKPLLYLMGAVVIFFVGPGKYSIDGSYNKQ